MPNSNSYEKINKYYMTLHAHSCYTDGFLFIVFYQINEQLEGELLFGRLNGIYSFLHLTDIQHARGTEKIL